LTYVLGLEESRRSTSNFKWRGFQLALYLLWSQDVVDWVVKNFDPDVLGISVTANFQSITNGTFRINHSKPLAWMLVDSRPDGSVSVDDWKTDFLHYERLLSVSVIGF